MFFSPVSGVDTVASTKPRSYSCAHPGGLMHRILAAAVAAVSPWALPAYAQSPDAEPLFAQHCAVCHANPAPDTDVPTRQALATLGPNAIVASLTEGNMRIQGEALSAAERIAIAERVAGRPMTAASARSEERRVGKGERAARR